MPKLGLIARIALLAIVIEVAAFGSLGWFYIHHYTRKAEDELRTRLELVGEMIANDELAISALSRNKMISGLVGAPYLNGLAIGGNGRVVVATDPRLLGRTIEDIPGLQPEWFQQQAHDHQWIATPDTLTTFLHIHASNNTHLYTVKLTVSTEPLHAEQRGITARSIGASLLFMLLTSAGIILIAQRFIARRVDASLGVLEAVEKGNLEARITVDSNDELGQLQSGINSMTAKLGSLLEDSRNKTLEVMASEATLQAALAEQMAIFESATHGIAFIKDRIIIRCNRRLEEIFGYGPGELIGQTTRRWYPDETSFEAGGSIYPDLARGGAHRREEKLRRKDGSDVWIHLSGRSVLPNDLGRGTVWVVEDITARKLAEEKLRESEELLRSAIETIGEGFVIYDPQDRLVICNEKYLEIYRHSAPAIVPGNTFEYIVRYGLERGQYSDAIGREAEWLAERLASHQRGNTDVTQRIDGNRWLRIREKRTRTGHIVGFRVDVSEIYNAKEAAEAANRAKSEFLANMSHEIRTPMNAILGLTQLVLETPLEERQRDFLTKAVLSGRTLLGILNDILDYSKIEAGRLDIESTPFSLEETVREVSDLFSARLAEKGLDLFIDIAPALPDRFLGDALRLHQVLANLLGNAIKFTERGEIRIQVEAGPLLENEDQCMLRFSVRDSGIGIARDITEKLFRPFTQADGSITRKYGGTGLGLAICHRLVTLMGGDIAASGEVGRGATFSFTIRVGNTEQRALADKLHKVAGMKVLVVDDQESARSILGKLLGAWGVEFELAANGEEALEKIREHHVARDGFCVVLLDWKMPDLDGVTIARRIAAEPEKYGHANRIMMVTAHDKEELLAAAGDIRLNGVLTKPVTPSLLFDALQGDQGGSDAAARQRGEKISALAGRRFDGAHVLVVEDNSYNQQVAAGFLEKLGITVSLADNGSEAVAMASHRAFDAILMDMHMPVMDGLEATRQIRALPDRQNMPIIAMTAAVMEEDRNHCQQAGMNDFVPKPVDPDELLRVLGKHLRTTGSSLALSASSDMPVADLPDLPGFDLPGALRRLGGDLDLLKRLLNDFAREHEAFPARIADSLAQNDPHQAAEQLHGLKGVAGNLGMSALATVAKELELQVRAGTPPELDKLSRSIADAREAIVTLADTTQSTGLPGRAEIAQLLAQLQPFLEEHELVPDALMQSLARLACCEAPGAPFARLLRQIDDFDHDGALATLVQIGVQFDFDSSPAAS